MKNPNELILFCSRCFASEDSSSWNQPVMENHCFNCGASGPNIKIPRRDVESIRQQASWVGKRYYPHDEDKHKKFKITSCIHCPMCITQYSQGASDLGRKEILSAYCQHPEADCGTKKIVSYPKMPDWCPLRECPTVLVKGEK